MDSRSSDAEMSEFSKSIPPMLVSLEKHHCHSSRQISYCCSLYTFNYNISLTATFCTPSAVTSPLTATLSTPLTVTSPLTATFCTPSTLTYSVISTFCTPSVVMFPLTATLSTPSTVTLFTPSTNPPVHLQL
uniref:Uncharacterized protein n=1 Tax=Octopus bimaculoides TaxID=37653 RepID=A0A0L8HRG6_OCTBM